MQFSMRCETYVRLNYAARNFRVNEARNYLRSIYVECKAEKLIAVATNSKILAAELIGEAPGQPDSYMHLTIDPVLVDQCRTESKWHSAMNVTYIPALKHATVKTTMGYIYAGNAALHFDGENKLRDEWRSIADNTEVSPAPMVIIASSIADLGFASPSGTLTFPLQIDGRKPVIVRDSLDPNWFGLFMPDCYDDNGKRIIVETAKLPEWMS